MPGANVIHVNYNLDEFEDLLEYHALLSYVGERYVPGAVNILLIDEVQMCEGFERAVNSLHASEWYDIYITGSSAFLLSSDLSTLFTGRTFEIEVFPFSFSEYYAYFGEDDLDAAFEGYARIGGMSGAYPYRTEGQRYRYIADVLRALVVRDIRQRHRIRNMAMINRIVDFLTDNVSNITSVRNIAAALGADGAATNHKTASGYIGYLCDAFAFYEVYAGVLYKKEIDFVAIRRDEKLYIQMIDLARWLRGQ